MKEKLNATKNTWVDKDAAPELGDEWFANATLLKGKKVIKRGRPAVAIKRPTLNMRIDADVLAHLRGLGKGWQTRVSALLREAVNNDKI